MTEQQPTADTHDMTWVLTRLAEEKDVLHAVLFTTDGLVLAHSMELHRDVADPTAASSSSLFSLGRSLSQFAQTPPDTAPRKIIVDLPDACVLIFGAGNHSVLAVSIRAEMTEPEVAVASAATIRAIRGLAPALSARARIS
ncbi:roadblock/LC7 domain-containing protein [Streptomyces sp. NPDC019922]|uniref:roadblock/LC7 domain-containing protein n=1 Tax=Streptomyces TaxID=1883 RepID=UPI0013682747|nr:roadblock/LC7 domain-containing protein [Streptomyces sp. SID7834]MYT58978.1 roadblock/LC7 domain-containing protein [Streptomyces sp. SID7834]